MNRIVSFLLLLTISLLASAQNDLEYEFDKARALLAQRKIKEAIKSLSVIYLEQPESGNINFLLGAAYAELPGESEKAIYHLKKSYPQISPDYQVGRFDEKRSPIHVYYYLTLSLVQQDRCAEAAKTLIDLKKHSNKIDPYFIAEAEKNMIKCPYEVEEIEKAWVLNEPLPEGYKPSEMAKTEEEPQTLDSAIIEEKGLLIQPLEYTTKSPIYGVQIASNINPSPLSAYSKVKNVDVFVDNEGIIRYVVGHFSYRKQAESLLSSLVEKGYKDAFVVNINDERKYPNELISYKNINIRSGIKGSVDFFVQLGAFKEEVPDSIIKLYLQIDNLQEVNYEEQTLLLVGKFETYEAAVEEKKKLDLNGNKSSFIVAFNRRKKIPLQEAINHSLKNE